MKAPIEFYFDFSSPYGYMASTRIEALAAKYDRQVEWHPVLLGVIFKTTDAKPLAMVPLKGEYSLHDMRRTARVHQIPFSIPSVFPIATQTAARAMLWVQNHHGKAEGARFAKTLLHAYFVDDINIGDSATVFRVAGEHGFDASQLASGVQEQDIKDQLKAEIDRALELGVFGAPYTIIDDEPFWGFDRFDQMELLLKNGKI